MSEFDDLTTATVAVCAARLDTSVSAHEFVMLVDSLVEAVRRDEREQPLPDGAGESSTRRLEPDEPGRRAALSYDDKVRMRARYDEALEGRERAPAGLLEELAIDFDCSISTVKNVCYRKDGT